MRKLVKVKPWIVRGPRTRWKRANTCRRPMNWTTTSRTACASTACCATRLPDLRPGSRVPRPAAIALAQRYNLDNRDQGARSAWRCSREHEGIWGCTFVGECTKVCPKHVDPAGAIQRYKLTAAVESMKSFFMPEARDGEKTLTYTDVPSALACDDRCRPTGGFNSARISSSSCAKATCIFVAWFVVFLLMLVRAVSESEAATSSSCLGGAPARVAAESGQPCLPSVSHHHVLPGGAAGAGGSHRP